MPTQNVPPVSVNVTSVNVSELEEEKRDRKRSSQKTPVKGEVDSIEISQKNQTVAESAEGATPSSAPATAHDRMKKEYARLEKVLKNFEKVQKQLSDSKDSRETASQAGQKGSLEAKASDLLKKIKSNIAELEKQGKNAGKILELKKSEQEIQKALSEYHAVHDELSVKFLDDKGEIEMARLEEDSSDLPSTSSVEPSELWTELEVLFKGIGLILPKSQRVSGDIEKVQAQATMHLGNELVKVRGRSIELSQKEKGLLESLKTASAPEKAKIEKELKKIKEEVAQLAQKKQELILVASKISSVTDNILRLHVAQELGVEEKPLQKKTRETAAVSKKEEKKSASPMLQTKSVETQKSASVHTASVQSDSSGEASGTGNVLLATNAFNDFSGTTLSIASTSNQLRSDSRQTEKMLKKLLRAVLAGNWEAVKSAFILLDKRASQIVIGMGAQTIKAMQSYETQMNVLSKSLGQLKGGEPDYNAQLAKINSDMNMLSLNRQAISNTLRDTLTMRETIGQVTHDLLRKDEQIAGALNR